MVRHLLEGNGTVPLDQFRAEGGLCHAVPRVMKRKYFHQTARQILKGVSLVSLALISFILQTFSVNLEQLTSLKVSSLKNHECLSLT